MGYIYRVQTKVPGKKVLPPLEKLARMCDLGLSLNDVARFAGMNRDTIKRDLLGVDQSLHDRFVENGRKKRLNPYSMSIREKANILLKEGVIDVY